jgi:hypothetical protein
MKMSENKYLKNTSPCRTSTAFDPAKRALERTGIEQDMLDFRPGLERALPAHRTESDRWWQTLVCSFIYPTGAYPIKPPYSSTPPFFHFLFPLTNF